MSSCLLCGGDFEEKKGKKYCSYTCKKKASDQRRLPKRKVEISNWKANNKDRVNEYAKEWYRENQLKKNKSSNIYIRKCAVTGNLFVARKPSQKISKGGEFLNHAIRVIKSNKISLREIETLSTKCSECGKEFQYNKWIKGNLYKERKTIPKYCSKKCSKKVANRKARAARRALEKGAFIERVDPIKVFKKHNFQCAECGCITPISLRGTQEPNAPELDHIIPLSKGGEHSYKNTQLLCRDCNSKKSDKIRRCQDQNMNHYHTSRREVERYSIRL